MSDNNLIIAYKRYIACLKDRSLDRLGDFVDDGVEYNGKQISLAGYRHVLEANYRDIPDLKFKVQLCVADESTIASRLSFHCTPVGRFLNVDVNGKSVSFCENVFYEYEHGKISRVWSVIDKAAIEAQLSRTSR
jgi:predicted ester cyclase